MSQAQFDDPNLFPEWVHVVKKIEANEYGDSDHWQGRLQAMKDQITRLVLQLDTRDAKLNENMKMLRRGMGSICNGWPCHICSCVPVLADAGEAWARSQTSTRLATATKTAPTCSTNT